MSTSATTKIKIKVRATLKKPALKRLRVGKTWLEGVECWVELNETNSQRVFDKGLSKQIGLLKHIITPKNHYSILTWSS